MANDILQQEACEVRVSPNWCRRLLHQLGMSKRKVECFVGALHTDEQQSVCKERLQAKLAWIQREFA